MNQIEFHRPLPPLAYYTLLVIWLGIENPSKIALLFLAAFAPLFLAVVSGVERISLDRVNGACSLGASGWQLFVYVTFPSCLPEIFTGLRTAIDVSYSTLVAAEMVAAAVDPKLILMDEPFGALDVLTCESMQRCRVAAANARFRLSVRLSQRQT